MDKAVVEWDCEFEVEARRIDPEEWNLHWPDISRELDTIPQYWAPYWTKDYMCANVMTGGWQAWGFGDVGSIRVIVLTQLIVYPASRVMQMMLGFGNSLDLVAPLIEATMERFAMEAECDYCEIVGREGWAKKFPRFKKVGVVLRCEVPTAGVH
jgi:hypothetical protein